MLIMKVPILKSQQRKPNYKEPNTNLQLKNTICENFKLMMGLTADKR